MEVNQVKALLESALTDTQNAVRLMVAARNEIDNAIQIIQLVRLTSSDPVGLPALQQMRDRIDEAINGYPRFDDDVNRYKIGL